MIGGEEDDIDALLEECAALPEGPRMRARGGPSAASGPGPSPVPGPSSGSLGVVPRDTTGPRVFKRRVSNRLRVSQMKACTR